MQTMNALPGGGASIDLASQLQEQQMRHQRILQQRTIKFWWPRVLTIVLAALVAAILGQFALAFPKPVFVGIGAAVLVFFVVWRTHVGLLITTISATAFFPMAFQVKSLEVYPVLLLIIVLFFTLLVQASFRVRQFVWPSFWAMWPQYGLILTAIISTIMIQVTWVAGVPKRVNGGPIIYDELFGIAMYCLPLVTVTITTAFLTNRDKWAVYIVRVFLIIACLAALLLIIEFKRIGATVYTFRYTERVIWWMKLKALAQLIGLGVIIAYAFCLYAKKWRQRIFFGILTGMCLLGLYFSLENSWWLEVGAALLIMTIFYSRKLFLLCCVAALPFLPLVKTELNKLNSVKAVDYFRYIIWQDMLRVWRMRPILGVGPGNLWTYDQHFTQLPRFLRDFNKTGLGVAHNGYLQILGEIGVVGEVFYIAFIGVFIYIAIQLFRRSNTPETLHDRILALLSLGLVVGSAAGDFTSGAFFLQPRQLGSAHDLPQLLTSWFVWGCVIYKDQLWRTAQRKLKYNNG